MEPVEPGFADTVCNHYFRLSNIHATESDLSKDITGLTLPIACQFFPETLLLARQIGEFRHVASVFISFELISSDLDGLTIFVSYIIRMLDRLGGYFNRLDFGDKGGNMLIFFGAPTSHEDDVERALNFVLILKKDLQDLEELSNLKWRAGIKHGLMYAGMVGIPLRCEYTTLGNAVNFSARLMMKSSWGEVFVLEEMTRLKGFKFRHKGDFQYKGFKEAVPTYQLMGKRLVGEHFYVGHWVGRKDELKSLHAFIRPIFKGKFAGLVYVYGETGIGKSRLMHEFRQSIESREFGKSTLYKRRKASVTWLNCQTDPIVRRAFSPFVYILKRYFDQVDSHPLEVRKRRFDAKYHQLIEQIDLKINTENLRKRKGKRAVKRWFKTTKIEPTDSLRIVKQVLFRSKAILAEFIGISAQDSHHDKLGAKIRYENTIHAVKHIFIAMSAIKPVILHIEDGHWLDDDSIALLKAMTHDVANRPIIIISNLRYNDDGSKPSFDIHGVQSQVIELKPLSKSELQLLIEDELHCNVSTKLHNWLFDKTRANPLFVQQLVRYSTENKLLAQQDGMWQFVADNLEIPGTINAILIARIDRLSLQVQEVVKTAAVIGREFEIMILKSVFKNDIEHELNAAEVEQIWSPYGDSSYMFKSALLKDVAYEMQLRSRLRTLHRRVAESIELLYSDNLTDKFLEIAFHYEQAEITDKAIVYLEKAADHAKMLYQNQQALDFYNRLLTIIGHELGIEHYDIDKTSVIYVQDTTYSLLITYINILLKRGSVLDVMGEWDKCQQTNQKALSLAESIDAKSHVNYPPELLTASGGLLQEEG